MIKQKCRSAAVLFGVVQKATESEPRRVSERTESEPGAPATDAASAPRGGRSTADGTTQEAVAHREAPPARGPGKALLLAAFSPDLVKRGLKAGELIKHLAPLIDGRGGGPPTMAQAGGKNPGRLPDALEAGRKWIENKLT
jgi:alanyl-tRNA synthetase